MKKKNLFQKSEKGQSMVELAVAIVILVILLAGVVDLGGMIFQWMAMRDAAQEGAAYASIYPDACNQTVARVLGNLSQDPAEIDVAVTMDGVSCDNASPADACAGQEVIITVTQEEFPITMPLLGTFLGSQSIRLEARVADTILRPQCP